LGQKEGDRASNVPSIIQHLRTGQIQQLALGVVNRSDRSTESAIDLFDLAVSGHKTGTLRGDDHASKFAIGQFVFLRSRDKRQHLVRITSVAPTENWGAICAEHLKAPMKAPNQLLASGPGDRDLKNKHWTP